MFELFEHKADIGVRGFGKSREEAFAECAKAMFSFIADLKKIEAKQWTEIAGDAQDLEMLLVNFLNELLYLKDAEGMLYSRFDVYITEEAGGHALKGKAGGKFALKGKAGGEKIDKKKHVLKADVKAASFHQLKVAKEKGKWVAQCVVDV